MTWSSVAPDGAKSVKANLPLLGENTTYTEVTLGKVANGSANSASTRDHYWAIDSTFDGRHRYINSPAYTTSSAAPDPLIGTGMDSVLYSKKKVLAESPDNLDVQYFLKNTSTQIMQLLGIRACLLIDVNPTTMVITTSYAHNASTASTLAHTGSNRLLVVDFTIALPSKKYLVFGGGIMSGLPLTVKVKQSGSDDVTTVKSTTSVTMELSTTTAASSVPLQVWVVCFGG